MDATVLAADDTSQLLAAIVELSHVRELEEVMAAVRSFARELTGADGVTFVLREGDRVFYADEDAIGPLWKGQRFDASTCISGWAMIHQQTAVIEDIYLDDRIPHDAYRPTFVKSLAMAPIRVSDPIGAIGAYWAKIRKPTAREVTILETLASASAIAVHNAELLSDARRAAHVREDFLAIASHELRTPLTSLLLHAGGMERALQGSDAPEDLKTRLASIKQSGWRMEALLDRLLDATRMMRGRILIAEGRLDLALLVRRVLEQFDDAAARSGSALRVSASDAVWILGDAQKLELVVSNLMSNAIKYGAGNPIDVTLEAAGDGARLSVLDRGIGIAEKDQVRIFDPFERAVSTANYGGFGVGLWAARKMAEAHGGRIQVTSTPGEGALFVVELASRMSELPSATT